MNPDIWGKHVWTSIHFIALGYPSNPNAQQKNIYIQYFNSLADVLPCKSCADHFKKLLTLHPLNDAHLANNFSLFEWTVLLHNKVNERLNKPIISLERAKKIYLELDTFNNEINKCNENRHYPIYICISLLISILIVLFFITRKCVISRK
jgi:hypothetical protein